MDKEEEMIKKPFVIMILLVVSVIGFWLYASLQPPADVQAKGANDNMTAQWLTLAIATVSLLTGVVGLVQKLIELKAASLKSKNST